MLRTNNFNLNSGTGTSSGLPVEPGSPMTVYFIGGFGSRVDYTLPQGSGFTVKVYYTDSDTPLTAEKTVVYPTVQKKMYLGEMHRFSATL